MEIALCSSGDKVRVIEDCLNGRRTMWDDPFKPGRNGLVGLAQRIEIHSPLALVILMLGTNDYQSVHQHNAWHSSQGIRALISAIRLLSPVCRSRLYWWLSLRPSRHPEGPSHQSSRVVRESALVWPTPTEKSAMRRVAISSMPVMSLLQAKSMVCTLTPSSTWFLVMSYPESPERCWLKMNKRERRD
jgi:hypothetical protein